MGFLKELSKFVWLISKVKNTFLFLQFRRPARQMNLKQQ